jgi:hypothetical protein
MKIFKHAVGLECREVPLEASMEGNLEMNKTYVHDY